MRRAQLVPSAPGTRQLAGRLTEHPAEGPDVGEPAIARDEAVAAAVACGRGAGPRLILADVADNPGGGGGGNTVRLMQALHEAGARGVLLGVFCDPALAAEAHARGVGTEFEAVFNRQPAPPWAPSWRVRARVAALSDGAFVGRRGLLCGTRVSMGPTARLALRAAHTDDRTEEARG